VAVDVALTAAVAPPPPRATPTPVVVDANHVYQEREVDTPAKKLSGESPDPGGVLRMKRGERVSVTVTFVVSESGEVREPQITESQGGERLDQAVLEAVKRWRFTPALKGGVAVKVRETRKFTYQAG
jgi:periplasmic protein TonB